MSKSLLMATLGSLLLSSCSVPSVSGQASSAAASPAASCAAFDEYQGSAGTSVTLLTSDQVQRDGGHLEDTWADFTRCTGIRIVNLVDTSTFEDFMSRIRSGNAPDLTTIPAPGVLADLVHLPTSDRAARLVPAPPAVTRNVDNYWNAAWREYSTVDGTLFASPHDASVKSVVWYSPKRFAAGGFAVPKTWAELQALSDRIASSGTGKPWCGGIEAGGDTGWPATDWLEEAVLGLFGGETYDKWTRGDLKFDSPQIRSAMTTLDGWMHNARWVNGGFGGVPSVATVSFPDAGKPVLDGACFMFPQATFYIGQWELFKKGARITPDGDIYAFLLPPADPDVHTPVMGGGGFLVSFANRPEVQKAWAYLSSVDWHTRRAAADNWVTANTGVSRDVYRNPISRLSAEILTAPGSTFRFDGSDLMPQVVQEVEWKQLTAWFAEGKPMRDVLRAIDAAWPSDAEGGTGRP